MPVTTTAMKIGQVDVLVETATIAGSEHISRSSDVASEVTDAYARAQQTILEVAASTADTLGKVSKRAARPSALEVEFGLKFTATGNVIVAGVSGEATLRVKLTYDAPAA
jgi:hypothetical protein